jgi:hypothetical protein
MNVSNCLRIARGTVRTGAGALAGLVLPGLASAQGAPEPALGEQSAVGERPTLTIRRTELRPVLDGDLSDPAWQSAVVIANDDLHQYLPEDPGRPSERSEFYLMYDSEFLYVGARLWDTNPELISAREWVQGQPLQFDDAIDILLDPFGNRRGGYLFQVNPNGVRVDGVFETTTEINRDWEGIWDAAARIDAEGWTAEVAIPFRTLNFEPSNPDWGFSITRTIARKQEEIAWSSFNRQVSPGSAGTLTGLVGAQQGRGIDVVPSLIVTHRHDPEAMVDEADLEPTLDVFYKLTPSLTGVLTLNTDFSATEVDDRQINLTRFSLFFPEKRDFFLQDVDIFSFGGLSENGIPFFSRRIGLSADGQPVDLQVGAKLTGRVGRWNVGVLDVQQDPAGLPGQDNLFVGRVAANVFSESSVGIIATHGNPRGDLDNSVLGTDFRYRNTSLPSGHTIEGELWYQQSNTEGLDQDDSAYGVRMSSPNSEGLSGQLAYEHFDVNFNPALGFVNRPGVERQELRFEYISRLDHAWIRSIEHGAFFENYDTVAGELQSRRFFLAPISIESHAGDEFGIQMTRDREVLVEDFDIADDVIIPAGDYTFDRYEIELDGANARALAPSVEVEFGDFFDGKILTAEAGIEWRPSPRFFLGMDYEYNDVNLPGGDFVTRLIQFRANFAFNAYWSWVNLLQYDNESSSVGINSRLRWNPRAGQDLYIVINQDFDAMGAFSGLQSQRSLISVKYTKTFRF